MARRIVDSADAAIKTTKPLSDVRSTDDVDIEIVTGNLNFKDVVEEEAFMNELVAIQVHDDPTEGALKVITVTVNGVNQPILRGRTQRIKRKYVEALARGVASNYKQQVNPADLSDIAMVGAHTNSYSFSILDDTPRGQAWYERIVEQQQQIAITQG